MDELVGEKFPKKSWFNKSATGSVLTPIVTNSIALVVTFIWAGSFIADIVRADYHPPTAIHVAFMMVLGSVFGLQIFNGRDSK